MEQMEQNVNLLQSLPSFETSKYLSPKFLLQIAFSLIALLLIIYFANLTLYIKTQNNLKHLTAQRDDTLQKISLLQNKINEFKTNSAAGIGLIGGLDAPTKRFTFYLRKLAIYTPYGIWLDKIVLNNKNNTFALSGKALNTALVPEFVKAINQKQIFGKEQVTGVKLQQDAKEKVIVLFTLDNLKQPAEPEKDKNKDKP